MDELPESWTYPMIQPKLIEKYLQIEMQSYSRIQMAAKQTIEYIKNTIKPGMNLLEIRKLCEEKLLELGADSFWYWDVGAFVFAGDETTVSVSGKQYVTSDRVIGNNDIITIDLSPHVGNIWGDYARTIIVENGMVVEDIGLIENPEWKSGLLLRKCCKLLRSGLPALLRYRNQGRQRILRSQPLPSAYHSTCRSSPSYHQP